MRGTLRATSSRQDASLFLAQNTNFDKKIFYRCFDNANANIDQIVFLQAKSFNSLGYLSFQEQDRLAKQLSAGT